MGNTQFSLLRQVIEGQAETPGDSASLPSPPDLSASFPVAGTPIAAPGNAGSASSVVRPALTGPTPRTAAHSGHMKLLFDNAPVAMAMFDTEMRYLLANRRWLEDFKLTKFDITGRSQYDLFPSLHPGWRHVYNRALGGQVVRSDRDAITQDGKRIVYRWEVRPWRHMDTTIGGVTISCERLYHGGSPAAAAPSEPQERDSGIWKTQLPLLALTDKGRILRVSDGLASTVPDCASEEEPVFFWDVFAEPGMHAPVRRATLVALDAVLSGGEPQSSIFTYPLQENEDVLVAAPPIQWLVSRLNSGLPGVGEPVALVVGLHGVTPPPARASFPADKEPGSAPGSQEWDQFTAEIARLRQAQKDAMDAASLSREREARLRAVLELAPCGLMVIDEHARPIYQNALVPGLLGRGMPEGQSMHEWLAEGARDEQHRAEIVRLWTEEVWRKRSTVPMPLTGTDGLHREVEMRPVALPGGGLLLMLQDVTESRRSEEMLRSTEAKFRTLVHENPLPVVLADRSGAVFDVNPACEQLLGHTRAEMRRMPLERWLEGESLALRAKVLQEMTRRGERYSEFPVNVIHAREYSFPVQLRLAVVPDAGGQPMFTLHFFSPAEQPADGGEDLPFPQPVSSARDEEEEQGPLVPTPSAALADAAARIRAFTSGKTPAEPVASEEDAQESDVEAAAPEDTAVADEPSFSAPAPAAPSVSYDPVLSEPASDAAVAQDPWRASVSPGSSSVADPWSTPQPAAENATAADPWRSPQAFSHGTLDPWSVPQSQPESATSPVAGNEFATAGDKASLSEAAPPPATTPQQQEATPIEEIRAGERGQVQETVYEMRPVALFSTDVHGRITAWTGEAETRFGFAEGEMLGQGIHRLFRPSDPTGLHGEILSLPGWETSSPAEVNWNFFHKASGRQEASFTLIPLELGGLAFILQEEERVAVTRNDIAAPAAPQEQEITDSPAQEPVAPEGAAASVETPFETQPGASGQSAITSEEEQDAVVSFEDEGMPPPPPLLDERDVPEEWPAVPANLLEDHLAPTPAEPAAVTPPEVAFAQTPEEAHVAVSSSTAGSPSSQHAAPLTLAPPQRMFADTPPPTPKPLSLAPPQPLFKDAATPATSAATEGLSPAPVAQGPSSPATVQQRPSFQELQREKLLLGETHHRVKNHLQIITSMLNLQMSTLHNEEARDALRSSQNRVRSIAALHQHLYLLTTGETADFRAFATGLISHLRECYHVPAERVSLDLYIPERALPEEWLMPLALALNEMVSNAFKHAWQDERPGSIRVSLVCGETELGTPHGCLTVTDDGVGLPEDFDQRDHPGMGMKILRVFAGQLGGEVRTRPGTAQGRGVSFELVFPASKE